MNENALKELWLSTLQLHKRFGTNQDQDAANDAQLRCVAEEHFEFQFAATQARDWQYNPAIIGHANISLAESAVEEAADVIVTMMGVLQNLGVNYDELAYAIYRVADKNDSKTLDTHAVNAKGKISRKE